MKSGNYVVVKFTKNAEKDKKLLKSAGLEEKVKKLLNLIAQNPFQNPPSYEKLVYDSIKVKGAQSTNSP